MKITKVLSLVFLFGVLSNYSCDKQSNTNQAEEVSIIGIDPCTKNYPTGTLNKGYVLQLNSNTKDTVVTYNLPLPIAKQVDPSINKIVNGFLLPQDLVIKATLSYRYATDQEKVYPVCLSNIDLSGISKVKKQIVINI